ncbi:MAG: methylglyoxal synthase [Clostridiales bacterium]|nr:methylglyoxal synthase [Clostridiales bacterium]MBO4579448.1 methylglyoxal synthase [Clostridiales bacterium]
MKIVLMADNRKMELLVNFCIAYRCQLEKHQLISIYNTAKLLNSAAGLDVSGLSVDYSTGFKQLASRAEFNEIDCVIYLHDGHDGQDAGQKDLLDACDIQNIPYATNIASAEILIVGIDQGYLDYRTWTDDPGADLPQEGDEG